MDVGRNFVIFEGGWQVGVITLGGRGFVIFRGWDWGAQARCRITRLLESRALVLVAQSVRSLILSKMKRRNRCIFTKTCGFPQAYKSQRVHVPNNWVLGSQVIVIIVQVLGKYMTIRYLDP